jgi:F0F1-type ATP synthase assembly protein I
VTPEDDSPPPKDPKPLPGGFAFLNMGFAVAVMVALGVLLGLWLDSKFHTSPLFLLIGLALGLLMAAMSVIKQIKTFL